MRKYTFPEIPEELLKNAETDAERREFIERLYSIWTKNPELRLGQLIYNAIGERDFFYDTDGFFMGMIEDFYEEIEKKK